MKSYIVINPALTPVLPLTATSDGDELSEAKTVTSAGLGPMHVGIISVDGYTLHVNAVDSINGGAPTFNNGGILRLSALPTAAELKQYRSKGYICLQLEL